MRPTAANVLKMIVLATALAVVAAAPAHAMQAKPVRPPRITCRAVHVYRGPQSWYERIQRLTSEFSNVSVPPPTVTIVC